MLQLRGYFDGNGMSFLRRHGFGYGLILLLLSGCGKGLDCVEQSSSPKDADPFQKVQVELGVDGSGSMLGYVQEKGSRYAQAIDSLSTLLADKSVPTRYWRIGKGSTVTAPQALSPTEFLKARDPEFYAACEPNAQNQAFPCVSSTLEQIYEVEKQDPKQETLRILLTDLEPDNAAVGQLAGKISNELKQNKDYKAILLGVRSEYNGPIFVADTGKTAGKYDTMGKNLDKTGRPFYVLMTGPRAAVDALVERFQKLPLDVNQALRASSFAIAGRDTLTLDKSQLPTKLDSCTAQAGAINRQKPSRNQQEQWLLLEQDCETKPVTMTIPSQPSISLAGSENLTPEAFSVSNKAVTIKQIQTQNNQILLTLSLDGEKFVPKKGEEITLILKKRDLDRATWQGWDTDVAEPDGAKTQNLNLFIGGLRDAVENVAKNPQQKEATEQAVKYCLGFTRY
jgi:hypothetical protein